jgi:hypothetical protein
VSKELDMYNFRCNNGGYEEEKMNNGAIVKLDKMPNNCSECDFSAKSTIDMYCVFDVWLDVDTEEYKTKNRHPQCPLKTLTPTPLDTLRDEIISELKLIDDELVWEDENKFMELSTDDKYFIYNLGNLWLQNIPLKLAHKITTYFMRLEEC